jgi:hypothetical protein
MATFEITTEATRVAFTVTVVAMWSRVVMKKLTRLPCESCTLRK